MSVVEKINEAVRLLRNEGFTVHYQDGWMTRGKGTMNPKGFLWHHTAGNRRGGNTGTLNMVTYGRSDLRNSLSNFYIARNGDIYVVAAGVSWHAGAGNKGTNTTLLGCEVENDGIGEPYSERSMEAQVALGAACCKVFDYPPENNWDHREHAPSRKIDRTGVDSNQFRLAVSTKIQTWQGIGPLPEEDDMYAVPIDLAPGQETLLSVEPHKGFFGATKSLLVLDSIDGSVVQVFAQNGGGGEVTVRGGLRYVREVSGGWLHLHNRGRARVGGALLVQKV